MSLLHLYFFWTLKNLPYFKRPKPYRFLVGIMFTLWVLFLAGRVYGGENAGWLSVSLDFFSMHWMGSVFILSVSLLLADLFCGFGFLFSDKKVPIRTAGLILGLTLVVLAHIQGLRAPVLEEREVFIKDIAPQIEGTTIAVLSDIHGGEMFINGNWLQSRIQQINELKPDVVVLAGDLFERIADPIAMIPVLKNLNAPFGVYAVRGNHDRLREGRPDVTGTILSGGGVRLLSNEWLTIQEGLILAGIDDLTSSRRDSGLSENNFQKTFKDIPPETILKPNETLIYLSHSPLMVAEAAKEGVDLMISGHTHNGQIWPFNFLVKLQYPYINGLYTLEGMNLYVSRGTGTWGPRMRLWQPGEITLLTLKAKRNL